MVCKPYLSSLFPFCELQQWVGLGFFFALLGALIYCVVIHLRLGPDMHIEKCYSRKALRFMFVCVIVLLPTLLPWFIELFLKQPVQRIPDINLRAIGWIFLISSFCIWSVELFMVSRVVLNQRKQLEYEPEIMSPLKEFFS